jgi:branched-chain amino acid transport system substrate-binding protein
MQISRRATLAAVLALYAFPAVAQSQDVVKIGLILPLTGPFSSSGKQMLPGARLYMQQNGDTVAGKKIQLIVKDDTGNPEVGKRIAQELIVNEKVAILAGFGLTPGALATAPLANEAKIPMMLFMAATSFITEKSPFIVRTSFSLPQAVVPIADWAAESGIKKVVTVVADYAPSADVEAYFTRRFQAGGGQVLASLRVPLVNPDFAPVLQRAADSKPDALFGWVPAGMGAIFIRQFVERGLDKLGMKFIAEGSMTEDDILNSMGDAAIGVITTQHYSAAHDSPENKQFVAEFKKANAGMRPNMMAVQSYDGMHMIYEALKKTGGLTDGVQLVNAMKGMSWISPRGPVSVDPETREITQNIYVRKVERVNGELYNVEFKTIPNVKDPSKSKQ